MCGVVALDVKMLLLWFNLLMSPSTHTYTIKTMAFDGVMTRHPGRVRPGQALLKSDGSGRVKRF